MRKWDEFDRFNNDFLPGKGEGDTLATQISTAVWKLVYKWYNDNDVPDNTHGLKGWCNDLSSYANWLDRYCKEAHEMFAEFWHDGITVSEYEDMLFALCSKMLNDEYLKEMNKKPKQGTVYSCKGPFIFVAEENEEEDA